MGVWVPDGVAQVGELALVAELCVVVHSLLKLAPEPLPFHQVSIEGR